MPQLMPLMWVLSTIVIMYIMITLIACFFNSQIDFLSKSSLILEKKINKYLW